MVVVLVVATALARSGSDPPSELRVVGPASTTSTMVVETTTSISPVPAETTTTTGVPATVSRTTRTTPPTTKAEAATTSTTLAVSRVACDASEVVVTATPDRPTYPRGSKVTVTVAALNRGARVCIPHDPQLEFFDATGAGMGGGGIADAFTMGTPGEPPPTWDPGETLSMEWPHLCGTGDPCPPGQYTVVATFGPFRSSPASFTIT